MSDSIWFALYIADYLKDTRRLSMMEHGAYLQLLLEYYSQGKSLDANASVLHRVCMAFAPDEQDAVQSVLDQFFTLRNGRYHHKRADAEIRKYNEIREKRRAAAEKRWAYANAMQKHMQVDMQNGMQTGMQTASQSQSQSQSHTQSETESAPKEKRSRFRAPSLSDLRDFCKANNLTHFDPEAFMDHYQANGWKIGKAPMKSWQHAARQWDRRQRNENANGAEHGGILR